MPLNCRKRPWRWTRSKIRDLQLSSGGLVQGQKLEDYVNEQVRRKPLEQLARPFVAVATRL